MEFKTLEDLLEYNKKAHESIFGKIKIQQEKALDIDGLSYFERITAISQPHKVFELDWFSYGSIDFANTFLPNVKGYKSTAMWMYDGAELFNDLRISENKTLSLSEDKKLINLLSYTYPKGVLAEKQKNTVSVGSQEICTFIEIKEDNSIDIHFKFGLDFKVFLKDYFKDIGKSVSISAIEEKTYKTNKQKFQEYFNRKLVHYNMMQYILETLEIEISEVKPRKRLIKKVEWLNFDKKSIIKDEKSKLSNVFFGEKIKLSIIGKRLKERHQLKITIGFKAKNKIIYPKNIKEYQFEITPKDNKAETPYFKIPFEWYDEAKEYYDYKEHKTKIKEEDLLQITAKIDIKKREIFLEDDEILVPNSYHRNYEELVGLFKKDTRKAEKDKKDNYENYFISLNKRIEKLVTDFEDFIYLTDNLKLNQIENRIEKDAKQLWILAVEQSQNGNLDDRPLYWARNKMQATLKRHPIFKNDIDLDRSVVKKDTKLDKIIILFEELSRNYTGIDFSQEKPYPKKVAKAEKQLQDAKNLPETTPEEITTKENAIKEAEENLKKAQKVYKILITGFDPFQLDYKFYGNKGVQTFNPSGIIALVMQNNNELLRNNIYVQTCIFPVRYEDFDRQVVENVVKNNINKLDLLITTSLNGSNPRFDIEKYAIEYRGGFHDNMCIGDFGDPDYDKSRFLANKSSELTVTTLPKEKIFGSSYNIKVSGQNIIYYDTYKSKTEGSGGNYLSNEVMYRATKVRGSLDIPVGHFHLGNLGDINNTVDSVEILSEIIKKILL